MFIKQLFAKNFLRNFSYLIICDSGDIYCIDPYDGEALSREIRTLGGELKGIINTHEHGDHTMGNSRLVQDFGARIFAHYNADGKIENVSSFLRENDRIPLEKDSFFQVMDTPGHTHAHLCLLLISKGKPVAIFTGDTLFNAGVGNCHNGGDPEILYETIRDQFMVLSENILVYPGHDYLENNLGFTLNREPSNAEAQQLLEDYSKKETDKDFIVTDIGEEKKINTFLRLSEPEIQKELDGDISSEKQVFLRLRELRDTW